MRFYVEILVVEANGFDSEGVLESDSEIYFLISDKTLESVGDDVNLFLLKDKFRIDDIETEERVELMVEFVDKYIEKIDEIVFETFFTYDNKLRCKKEDLTDSLKRIKTMYREGE